MKTHNKYIFRNSVPLNFHYIKPHFENALVKLLQQNENETKIKLWKDKNK